MLRKVIALMVIVVILSIFLKVPLLNDNNEINKNNLVKVLLVINNFVVSFLDIVVGVFVKLGEVLKTESS